MKIVDRESGSTITPLKLQKILYYAQGYYLAMYDEALFPEDFQAWAHGPANEQIYEKYKEIMIKFLIFLTTFGKHLESMTVNF